ncbi:MAG: hypothetical protein NC417_08515 [Candidatus Gastranaerophilales bacterium]|nr:hypothetical protein [Candidatus Gastranaerophilales bacterium]
MRITNKIMQKNNLSNINTNKIYQDKLTNQMSTQKKVSRPSDDPVVAIRALRLRSNVNDITQVYTKNIPDAESWIEVTEGALQNLTEVIKAAIGQCTKGANGDLEAKDRQVILEQLKALADEVYVTGDSDYAGRYVFTGYRTNTSLRFADDIQKHYTITEQLDNSVLDKVTHVVTHKSTTDILDWNETNFFDDADMKSFTEQDIEEVECYRIRLAYSDCMAEAGYVPTISLWDQDATPQPAYTPWHEADGTPVQIQSIHSYEDPYSEAANDPDAVIYVPDTGEILLGTNRYNTLAAIKDDYTTKSVDEGEIRITYEKEKWVDGDLRPEHYFACEATEVRDGEDVTIKYNEAYLEGNDEKQVIEYDVGYNQKIQINSTADECFVHGIGRDMEDLAAAMQEVLDIEAVQTKIDTALKNETDEEKKKVLQDQLDAVGKAYTYAKNKCQRMFESGITAMQGYLDLTNLAITNNGTRGRKLELIENRMQDQKTTFETLKSENEDIDITEVAIQLSSAELTYEAALMASGKVMQTTLLNFI